MLFMVIFIFAVLFKVFVAHCRNTMVTFIEFVGGVSEGILDLIYSFIFSRVCKSVSIYHWVIGFLEVSKSQYSIHAMTWSCYLLPSEVIFPDVHLIFTNISVNLSSVSSLVQKGYWNNFIITGSKEIAPQLFGPCESLYQTSGIYLCVTTIVDDFVDFCLIQSPNFCESLH